MSNAQLCVFKLRQQLARRQATNVRQMFFRAQKVRFELGRDLAAQGVVQRPTFEQDELRLDCDLGGGLRSLPQSDDEREHVVVKNFSACGGRRYWPAVRTLAS